MVEITYALEPELSQLEFVDLLHRSSLSDRRPVDRPEIIHGMLAYADIVLTARADSGLLVGIARAITDYHYCTYLSDLAVRNSHQKQGIGQELIRRVREAGGPATIIVLAAPKAVDYYGRIGFGRHPQAWLLPPDAQLR